MRCTQTDRDPNTMDRLTKLENFAELLFLEFAIMHKWSVSSMHTHAGLSLFLCSQQEDGDQTNSHRTKSCCQQLKDKGGKGVKGTWSR
jgi:hypothetical protein